MRNAKLFVPIMLGVVGCVSALLSPPAGGQCPKEWVTNPQWGNPGVESNLGVEAFVNWDPDGAGPEPERLVVGGGFKTLGDMHVDGIAQWDGISWSPFADRPAWVLDDGAAVTAFTIWNGDLIVAWEWLVSGSGEYGTVCRWTGSGWEQIGGVFRWSDYRLISAMAVYNGELVVAGDFTFMNGQSSDPELIARWDGTEWKELGRGFGYPYGSIQDRVTDLVIYDGLLIASHGNEQVGGVDMPGVAVWDGTTWHSLDDGLVSEPSYEHVQAICVYDGELIAAGAFYLPGSTELDYIAAWDGSSWRSLNDGTLDECYALGVFDGKLLVSVKEFATFGTYPGYTICHVMSYDGLAWQSLAATPANNKVTAFHEYGGDVLIGGWFGAVNGVGAKGIARWDGSNWHGFFAGFNDWIRTVGVVDGELYVAGAFESAGVHDRVGAIARWDGSAWQPLGEGLAGGTSRLGPRAFAIHDYNGDVVVGGDIEVAGGQQATNVARWNGSAWHAMGEELGNGTVSSFEIHDGDLYAAGSFEFGSGTEKSHVARWDGAAWQPVGVIWKYIFDLLSTDGYLYACGSFIGAGGQSVDRIARWDGVQWEPVGEGFQRDGGSASVSRMLIHEGSLIAVGNFDHSGDATIMNIARWNGTAWEEFGGGLPESAHRVVSLDGNLYVTGVNELNGQDVGNIVVWDGADWSPLDAGGFSGDGTTGFGGTSPMEIASFEGDLVAVGAFEFAGGKISAGFAWLSNAPNPADLNGDDLLNFADVTAFIDAFVGGDPLADLNDDGLVNFADVTAFIDAFVSGC